MDGCGDVGLARVLLEDGQLGPATHDQKSQIRVQLANSRERADESGQVLFRPQSAYRADSQRMRGGGRAAKTAEVDAVVADMDLSGADALVVDQMTAQELAVHHDGIGEAVR